jgi:hypothetical protein
MSDRSMRVGELSMECNGKAGFAGFGFLAAGRKWRLVEPTTAPKAKTATRSHRGRRLAVYSPEPGSQNGNPG